MFTQFALLRWRGEPAGAARRSMRGHRTSAATNRAPASAQPKAGRFLPAGSSQGSRVFPDTRLRPAPAPEAKIAPAQMTKHGHKPV